MHRYTTLVVRKGITIDEVARHLAAAPDWTQQASALMNMSADVNERQASTIDKLAQQIKALPHWTQQLKAIRERAADSRDAKPMP
jgi:hypothetical protein